MGRLRYAVVATVVLAGLLTACGTPDTPLPTIHFVSGENCPTKGTAPYDPSPRRTNGTPVGTAIDEMPHTHVDVGTKIGYAHDPPTSGCHYNTAGSDTQLSAPIQAGVYDQHIDAEFWVHNLEHGYIAVLYNCPSPPGCKADVDTLHNWYKTLQPDGPWAYAKVIVVPWTTMKDKFAVVSWDWYIGLQSLDMTQVQAFYDNHRGQGPEPTAP